MKILTVFATLAMTVGLAACGGKKECKTHSWGSWETTKAATCLAEGSEHRTCKKCGKEQTRSIDKLEHQWEEVAGTKVEATCEEAGHYSRKCSLCQTLEIPALGHDWVDDEDQTAAVAPTCTTAGTKLQHCSHDASHTRTATVDALGHDWGEWEETKAPKCEEDGERKHTCQREGCGVEEKEVVAKLGHHLVAQADDGTAAKEDFAKVRVFECDREGCDYATFGFSAIETSSKSGRLLEETVTNDKGEEEVGKRFWGRPIGNDVALDENGTADRDSHEPVYNPETKGDLFEYNFTLTDAQVAALGEDIACYADAKPADYLNGKDFWAADPNGEEWTPGFYIEGENAGQQITDYRYILYVDGSPVQFDESIKAPVPNGSSTNIARGEFIMPYIFHFTAGDHSISLRMAGGYRSLFFNFIFKSYEAPEVPPEPPVEEDPWVLDETTVMPEPAADEGVVVRYKNKQDATLVKYEIAAQTGKFQLADDGSRWKTDPSTGEFKLNNFSNRTEGCSFSFKFSLPQAFEGKMYQRSYMDSYKNNYTKKLYYQTNNHANIEVKFNGGDAIDLSQFAETTFQDIFGDGTGLDNSEVKDVEIGNVVLKASNSGTFKRVETLNMITSHFVFIGKDHVHTYSAGEKASDSALRVATCACGDSGYELQAADVTEGHAAPASSDKNTRLGKNKMKDIWNITGIEAGTYDIYLQAQNSQYNDDAYWNAGTAQDHGGSANDNGNSRDFRYKAFVGEDNENAVKVDFGSATDTALDQYSDFGLSYAGGATWTNKPVARITIAADSTTFTIQNMNNGYSIWIYGVRLMPVAIA